MSVEPESRYTGPYLSGDEIELLEAETKKLDEFWLTRSSDTE